MTGSYRVPRPLRVVNVLALLLFAGGAALYARAWVGMRELITYVPPPDAPLFAAMARFHQFSNLSRTGLTLVIAAVLVAVLTAAAAVAHRRRAAIAT